MKREAEIDSSESADKLPKTMSEKHGADQEAAFISPSSARPDRETQLFDRQLRLWESSGQERFKKGAVGICDCSATSTQIAKNLVLSGLGHVEMYDTGVVRQSDVGNSFFLEQASLGDCRATECRRLLGELSTSKHNPVMGNYHEIYNAEYWDGFDDLTGFSDWTAHICVRMVEDDEYVTESYCDRFNVPSIFVQTCGLVASIRVSIGEFNIIQTHSESLVDLRLDSPFPALSEFVESFDMEKMDSHEHAHVPAVVIIIHFLEVFKSKHDGKLPQNSAERGELKEMILAEKRNADEDNFDEAVGLIWKACQPTQVPAHIEKLFSSPHCDKAPWFDGQFWLLVRSLREFVKQHPNHQLPLSGVLPDMKSDTKNYIKMQTIYRQKAAEDLQTFKEIVQNIKSSLKGRTDDDDGDSDGGDGDEDSDEDGDQDGDYHDPPDYDVSPEMVETFVKNSAHIRVIRGDESPPGATGDISSRFKTECEPGNENYTVTWYIAFQALSDFRSKNDGEYPGMRKGQEDKDFDSLLQFALEFLDLSEGDKEAVPEKLEKALKEMVRSAGSELPHISSLVGGLVAQEVTKLITRQYVPMTGTCIFDGYRSSIGFV
ncbi:hypothetical protein PTTG_00960 [Puccinia triticina 1-1 BBBD Race 1]|uniref:NEDD8-activating enzyme E1 regulatory subunit n=2 Tax=Puccinia triticina TaxID=208348 RepID=A0A180GW47_PUCT1|nr:uncharacterized protein PtA15_3A708 [Puccinia triticina]OAV96502.1 hypothetical protein PTTG_00960 [Puccinia triticina 1-1 BBBD Race 1]WAQ83338.1 hypothetical protein PtA15_3A708 [Puccinia triticina]